MDNTFCGMTMDQKVLAQLFFRGQLFLAEQLPGAGSVHSFFI